MKYQITLIGNYTNDTGFPSVDSMRIHDSHQYQDFSFKIKAEKPINEYRHLVKSLISNKCFMKLP